MAERVAMEALHPCLFFLQVDLYLADESSWQALHTLGNLVVLELLEEPLLLVRSCRIENVSLVNSSFHGPGGCPFPCSSIAFSSFILASKSVISCSILAFSSSNSFL